MPGRVDITETVVKNLLKTGRLSEQVPALARALATNTKQVKGCSSCSGKAAPPRIDLPAIKRAIANLPDDEKTAIKRLLNVDRVSILIRDIKGRAKSIIF